MMSWMWFCSPSRTMRSSPTRWYRTPRSNDCRRDGTTPDATTTTTDASVRPLMSLDLDARAVPVELLSERI
ncbi:hypothetical protein HMPREF1549_00256 [Actinomyces johnsonii F0510]|uniref:Uncharacterized protein n=1 Tax=Actinomyces johnsonii F0510 TaxID=1227262 RepID=U1QN24_9ACTO|nr:hypothetical protein HMPREF1549_00256 [Actinomyces johnsonii F0510]